LQNKTENKFKQIKSLQTGIKRLAGSLFSLYDNNLDHF